MRLVVGFILATLLGAVCRVARIPMPAPNAILGSLLAVAMSSGYVVAGKLLERQAQKSITAKAIIDGAQQAPNEE